MRFCEQWIQLIMKCVSKVSYQIKVNGALSEAFTPERGLWRGDPYHLIFSYYALRGF
jgi:hypothetical protein